MDTFTFGISALVDPGARRQPTGAPAAIASRPGHFVAAVADLAVATPFICAFATSVHDSREQSTAKRRSTDTR